MTVIQPDGLKPARPNATRTRPLLLRSGSIGLMVGAIAAFSAVHAATPAPAAPAAVAPATVAPTPSQAVYGGTPFWSVLISQWFTCVGARGRRSAR